MADKKEPYNPIVPVEGEPQQDQQQKSSGSGLALSEAGNKKIMIIGVSIFFSVIIYFFMFSSDNNKDTVDNRDIVRDNSGNTSSISNQDRKVIDSLEDIGLTYNDFNDNVSNNNDIETNRELLELPTIPSLPEEVKENIEVSIKQEKQDEKKEETYSKEDVDKLINEKLKSFEDEIKKAKDESERLAKEIERQKILEEEEEKKRQAKGGIIANILSAPNEEKTETEDPFTETMSEEEKKRQEEEDRQLRMQQRARIIEERKSASMFKLQGGGPQDEKNIDNDSIIVANKDLLNNISNTEIKVQTTKTADMSRTILQGKLIQAILETSIDTDVQSQVRAVVTRDIYSESEKNILIPRGSKLVGSFKSDSVSTGVARINISWNRIVRTDGLSIGISADSSDNLGRGGVAGDLDNKYAQAIQNSILSSLVTVGTSLLTEKISGSVGITSTTTDTGSTTTSGKASDYAIVSAAEDFSKDMKELVDKLKVSNPTLRIAQGTKLNVVVNQDLQLPIFKQNK